MLPNIRLLAPVNGTNGIEFDLPDKVDRTPVPGTADLALLRGEVGAALAQTYPAFAARVLGVAPAVA